MWQLKLQLVMMYVYMYVYCVITVITWYAHQCQAPSMWCMPGGVIHTGIFIWTQLCVVCEFIHYQEYIAIITIIIFCIRTSLRRKYHASIRDTGMLHCLYAWQHKQQVFAVGHFPIFLNSLTLHIAWNINPHAPISIRSMSASLLIYIYVVLN